MGNLRSVQKAFEYLGAAASTIEDPDQVKAASILVIPGVGAFPDAIGNLGKARLIEPILDHASRGRPILGICLGMQLLLDVSHEKGQSSGLGLIPGRVIEFERNVGFKVPHMGWNQLEVANPHPILEGFESGSHAYFVHSFHAEVDEPSTVLATTNYGSKFPAIIGLNSVIGFQFHPEKSHRVGLDLLEKYLDVYARREVKIL